MLRYLLPAVLLPSILCAQHPTHPMPQQNPMKPMAMMMIDPLGVSMERMGSGTLTDTLRVELDGENNFSLRFQ